MGLIKYKLGDLIQLCDARNDDLQYGIEDVKGISIYRNKGGYDRGVTKTILFSTTR